MVPLTTVGGAPAELSEVGGLEPRLRQRDASHERGEMTSNREPSNWSALLLVGLGVLTLVTSVGWLAWLSGWIWPLLSLVVGGAAVAYYLRSRESGWALTLGAVLVAVSLGSLVGTGVGALLFLALGAGLLVLYLRDRARWWALLPSGALFTLTLVTVADALLPARASGWLLFLGIAATFALLTLLPQEQGGQRWALYPALVALALAVMMLFTSVGDVPIALLLIAVGAFLLWRRSASGAERSGPPREPRRSEGA